MQLTVRDVARLVNHSEKTIYRWIQQGILPAYRINDRYRFNRAEILDWAARRKLHVARDLLEEKPGSAPLPSLAESLEAGGIFYRLDGRDRDSVLRGVVEIMRLPAEVDRDLLREALVAREEMASTGIGDGVAVPHVRNPIILSVPRPLVTLCFLERAVDWGALDQQPVGVLFTLASPDTRVHLHLLSRLAFALKDAAFKEAVARQAMREEIFAAVHRVEATFAPTPGFPHV